ncbi:hypothetical protein BS50DRAFT_41164 [Corynespora cassiicola Philippines]|uniref:Uncharacterized protein n=1 Tax=Corynespora cassiicola Philippines TaxID=1448308 RepID=A0A2T2PDT6_CORCC|nr:hypothetical protein BS50DRAFT_41164 [Corynespora cassiicola Philippines]
MAECAAKSSKEQAVRARAAAEPDSADRGPPADFTRPPAAFHSHHPPTPPGCTARGEQTDIGLLSVSALCCICRPRVHPMRAPQCMLIAGLCQHLVRHPNQPPLETRQRTQSHGPLPGSMPSICGLCFLRECPS